MSIEQLNEDLKDIWEESSSHHTIIQEALNPEDPDADSVVDGVHIIARARGPAFFPDTESGNGVFYSLQAWENALSNDNLTTKLNDRLMFGTIGHDIKLDDNAIRKGDFSHITTKIWIEDGVGMAEYLVYNTEPGRNLNMLLRTNSKIRVSTKAKGRRLPSTTKVEVDPDLFFLDRIDFVLDPGYLIAGADLVESKDHEDDLLNSEISNNEESLMDTATEKLIQVLESRIAELGNDKNVQHEFVESLKQETQAIREECERTQQQFNESQTEIETLNTELNSYRELGTVKDINLVFEESQKLTSKMEDLTVEFNESLASSLQTEEISEDLKKYREIGTVEELEEILESADRLADEFLDKEIKSISESNNLPVDSLMKLKDRGFNLDEIKEFAESISSTQKTKGSNEEEEVNESRQLSSRLFSKSNRATEDFEESASNTPAVSRAASLSHKLLGVGA